MWKDMWGAVKKEEDADADGIPDQVEKEGILLGTGERKFPSISMEDRNGDGIPDGRDTDGDGLTDGYELGYTDPAGHPLPQASTMPVPVLQSLTGNMQSLAYIEIRCMGGEYDCRSAKVNSAPDYVDTDEDSYSDKVDEKPIEYYQRPIIFLHGVISNTYNAFGASNLLANKYSSGADGTGNNVDNALLYKERLIDLQNQRVYDDYETNGLYSYLIANAKDPRGRALYTHGKNMFVFNYANQDAWYNNSEILNHYVYRLLIKGNLKGPTIGVNSEPIVDFVVHSMGGLVVRYFNEQIYPHSIQVGRVVTIGTPHLGGDMASIGAIGYQTTLSYGWSKVLPAMRAFNSLSFTNSYLNIMNNHLTNQTKRGAQYYSLGAVALPEWQSPGSKTYMPTSLMQYGAGGTHTYEYSAGSSGNYESQANQLISNAIRDDIDARLAYSPLAIYAWRTSDQYVHLNSAFGNYGSGRLPFDQRWGYIGLAWSNKHEEIHHNVRVKNRVTALLAR